MDQPLVSVICLCYNHERFVRESIQSAIDQTYSNIQIIVVDDASTDGSVTIIEQIVRENPRIEFLALKQNMGNCKAFNRGLVLAKGAFVVDLATDDIMLPQRVEKQIRAFDAYDESYGVNFTDATYIDSTGKPFRDHVKHLFDKGLIHEIPQGDVYRNLLTTYFICSPTMMIRKEVLDVLNGYDENLAYEDFDFWVRSSRIFRYCYLNEKLTKVRRNITSMSSGWYTPGDKQLHSTYLVCQKAQKLNRSPADHEALIHRVRYELRQSVFSGNDHEAELFFRLLSQLKRPQLIDRILLLAGKVRIPFAPLRRLYHKVRFGKS
jgi:glycosyltransferase involved in cell wall biosynthesis